MNKITGIYHCNYRKKHSVYLNKLFNISDNGVDYYNSYNVAFEFKETFSNKKKCNFFRIPISQLKIADYLVFCYFDKTFYIVNSKILLETIKGIKLQIRLGKVVQIAFFRTNSIEKLKSKIEGLKE